MSSAGVFPSPKFPSRRASRPSRAAERDRGPESREVGAAKLGSRGYGIL